MLIINNDHYQLISDRLTLRISGDVIQKWIGFHGERNHLWAILSILSIPSLICLDREAVKNKKIVMPVQNYVKKLF